MKFEETNIKDAYIIYIDIHKDNRGYFSETFNKK